MRGRQWKALAMATVTALTISACNGDDAPEPADEPTDRTEAPAPAQEAVTADLPEGVTQEQFQEGQQLFTGAGGCHACHGPQATGTQLGPDLTDGDWLNIAGRDLDEIVQVIQQGVPQPVEHPGPMPPNGGANISEDQVQALAAYVYGISEGGEG